MDRLFFFVCMAPSVAVVEVARVTRAAPFTPLATRRRGSPVSSRITDWSSRSTGLSRSCGEAAMIAVICQLPCVCQRCVTWYFLEDEFVCSCVSGCLVIGWIPSCGSFGSGSRVDRACYCETARRNQPRQSACVTPELTDTFCSSATWWCVFRQ